jgi:hypothetical protein
MENVITSHVSQINNRDRLSHNNAPDDKETRNMLQIRDKGPVQNIGENTGNRGGLMCITWCTNGPLESGNKVIYPSTMMCREINGQGRDWQFFAIAPFRQIRHI